MRLYSPGYYAEAKRLGFSPYTLASTRPENGQSSRSAERTSVSVKDEKSMPITGAIGVGQKPSKPSTEIAEIYGCVKRMTLRHEQRAGGYDYLGCSAWFSPVEENGVPPWRRKLSWACYPHEREHRVDQKRPPVSPSVLV